MKTQTDGRLISFENSQPLIHDPFPDILSHTEKMLSHVGSKYTLVSEEMMWKQVFSLIFNN